MALFKSQQRREPVPEATLDVWPIRDTPNMNVVGESHYARQICQLLPQRLLASGAEVLETVTIRHDVGNSHDPNAVEVRAHVQRAHELDQSWLKGDGLPPPGWHPDPHGVARLRYWNGFEWSSHTAD